MTVLDGDRGAKEVGRVGIAGSDSLVEGELSAIGAAVRVNVDFTSASVEATCRHGLQEH